MLLPLACMSVMLGALLFLASLWWGQRGWKWGAGQRMGSVPTLPVLGSLLSLWGPDPPHMTLRRLAIRHGDPFSLYLGPHFTVVISSIALAREVLLQKGRVFGGRPHMVSTDLLSRGGCDVAFADLGPRWKRQRHLLLTANSRARTEGPHLEAIVNQEAEMLCCQVLAKEGKAFDPTAVLTGAVTNVVCMLVFGSSYQPGDAELEAVMACTNGIAETAGNGSLVDTFPWLQIFPNRQLKKLRESIGIRDELLTRKLREHQATLCLGRSRDLLDALLHDQKSVGGAGDGDEHIALTEDHVLMTAADAFGAGVETTATTLRWAIAFLLHHPEVQARVQGEIDAVIGGREPRLTDRGQLPLLEATIQEVLRFRPIAPLLIPHVALADTSIGEHAIPKGTHVILNMWAIHHSPFTWDHPERFNPDRFMDNGENRASLGGFLPFGAGPRACVGEPLARVQLFLLLSWLLQRFTFSPAPGHGLPNLQGRSGLVLQPNNYWVCARPREVWGQGTGQQ